MATLGERFGQWWRSLMGGVTDTVESPVRPPVMNGVRVNQASSVLERQGETRIRDALYHYKADVLEVYDGDTITVNLDLGLRIWQHNERIRLWKINTPEVRGPEREAGLAVRDYVRGLILGKTVIIRTILDKRGEDQTGKYGRLLGEVLLPDGSGNLININELLLAEGKARPMGADGSSPPAEPATRSMAPSALPEQITCPYCGETRAVNVAEGEVQACSNCLDEAFKL